MDTLQTALHWRNLDIATIPIRPRAKQPLIAWKRYQTELPTIDDLKRWYSNTQNNIAVVCGWKNLTILDFDDPFAYFDFLRDYPEFENTYTVQTSRGAHVYVFCEDSRTRMSSELDIKANGYCLCPPSIHPSGTEYKIIVDKEIIRVAASRLSPSTVRRVPHITINGNNNTVNINMPISNCTRRSHNGNGIISRIKNAYPITRLFTPAKYFDNGLAFAHCPMPAHPNGDHDPSLSLDLINDRCQCISRSDCPLHSAHGNDVIDAYRILYGLSFKAALAQMANELEL